MTQNKIDSLIEDQEKKKKLMNEIKEEAQQEKQYL